MNPEIVILGGGPGALFSYYGALAAGYARKEVVIWAKEPTFPPGAFWLHQLPPNFHSTEQPIEITCYLQGSAEIYSKRQWGKVYPTSAQQYNGRTVRAYNPHVIIPQMWERANTENHTTKWDLHFILDLAEHVSSIIVTFPITYTALTVMQELKVPVYHSNVVNPEPNNYCLYNGMEQEGIDWVRVTKAFGKVSVEYPNLMWDQKEYILECEERVWGTSGQVTLVPEMHPETKPLEEVVIGRRRNVLLTGRWATLRRKALSHDSWFDVRNWLQMG